MPRPDKVQQDKEEQDILESLARGEWRTVPNLNQELKRYQQYARYRIQRQLRH